MKILNRYTQEVIIERDLETVKGLVEIAVREGISLYGADLSGANLYGANLYGADLLCVGNMREIFTLQIDRYKIGFTKDFLQIGCQRHLISDWKKFSDEDIGAMDSEALSWWNKWNDHLFKTIHLTLGGVF